MARYRLRAPHVIDGRLSSAGEIVEFDGAPTPDMQPLDPVARARVLVMPWAYRGWRLRTGPESLPGGRFRDGSPVLLNRPENFGRPLTELPPQPDFRKEIPHGTAKTRIQARKPPRRYWATYAGSISEDDPLVPFSKG